MKKYYRVILGRKNKYAKDSYKGNYIGVGWLKDIDLSNELPESWREFNKKYIPIYLEKNPGKTKITAGLACGMTHTVCKGISIGDIVLSPDGEGNYFIGEVTGEYMYQKGAAQPHRRPVRWFSKRVSKEEMSESLRKSVEYGGTVSNISKHAQEIEDFISGNQPNMIMTTDETIEDPSIFALEKHLEDFLVQNWHHTELGKRYDIYKENGENIGQQYPTDTGPIDILAISKDKKELLVVELKKGRVSDIVVGQIQRYMGYVQEELAEVNQKVRGVIIAFEDDIKIQRALSVATNIDFYTYKINFKLEKKK